MTKPTLNFNGLDLEKIEADPRDAVMYQPSQRKFTTQRELDNKARNAKLKFDFWKLPGDFDGDTKTIRFLPDMSGSMYPQIMKTRTDHSIGRGLRNADKPLADIYMIDLEASYFGGMTTNASANSATVTAQTLEEIQTSIKNLMKKFELNSEFGKTSSYDPKSITEDFYFPNRMIKPRQDAFFESPYVATSAKLEALGISKDFMKMEIDAQGGSDDMADAYMDAMAQIAPAPLMLNERHFDETIGGFDLGRITSFVGPTGSGLTRLSMALAAKLAAEGHRVLYVSMEMSVEEVEKRVQDLAMKFGLSAEKAHHNVIAGDEQNIDTFMEQTRTVIDSGITLKAVIIDRIETFLGDRAENTNKLHRFASEMNLPLIVTAGTNRQSKYDSTEAPSWPISNMTLACVSNKIVNIKNHKGIEIEMIISKDRNAGKTGLRSFYDIQDNEFIR